MANILLIDDDSEVIEVVEMYLEEENHILTSFSSAQKAIAWTRNNKVDLLITDILMPEMNGLELIAELKENFCDFKILAMSGGGESGGIVTSMALDQAMDLGAEKALVKPFSKEDLVNRIKNILNLQ